MWGAILLFLAGIWYGHARFAHARRQSLVRGAFLWGAALTVVLLLVAYVAGWRPASLELTTTGGLVGSLAIAGAGFGVGVATGVWIADYATSGSA